MDLPPMVFDQTQSGPKSARDMDHLWARGWRHFGKDFFRYSVSLDETGLKVIQPLRLRIQDFAPSKSQRRVLRKNPDVRLEIVPASLHESVCAMFQRHKERFTSNIPDHLSDFLGETPGLVIECLEFQVWLGRQLIAASFLDIGEESVSSVYGVFEPAFSERSLGILTMLLELQWARDSGKRYYYPGYATREPSHYDYKKNFRPMEFYDWLNREWRDLPFLSSRAET